MYEFSLPAVTSSHKVSGLNETTQVYSQNSGGQKSQVGFSELKSRCQGRQGICPKGTRESAGSVSRGGVGSALAEGQTQPKVIHVIIVEAREIHPTQPECERV